MFISNRDIKLNVVIDNKTKTECLEWKFGYKENKEAKERYKKSKKSLLDGSLFPNTKTGERLARADRAESIIKYEKEYKYNENSDLREATFEDYKNLYLEYRSKGGNKVEANTTAAYNTAFKNFKGLNNIKMKNITELQIETIAYELIDNGLKASSVKSYLKQLNCMFQRASEIHKIIEPLHLKRIIFKEEVKKEKQALTVSDSLIVLEKFKANKNKQYYLLVYLAVKLGMRLGEILGLTWNNIDFENQIIKINTQFKNVGTIGSDKLNYALSEILKTGNSNREIFVSKKVIQILKENRTINSDNRVFDFKDCNSTSTMISRKLTSYGFPDISVHNLRHTFVTSAHQHGMDYDEIGSYIGDNPITVQKIYCHINGDSLKNIKRIVDTFY